jgi:hypothetical protein
MPKSLPLSRLQALALFAAAFAAGPAYAQVAPGLSGSSTSGPVQMQEVWQELAHYGRCIAGQRQQEALDVLRAETGSRAESERLGRLLRDRTTNCSQDFDLVLPAPLFRGAIAEGLYDRRAAMPADLAWTPIAKGEPVPTFSHIARCYLPGNEARVAQLVEKTRPGSRDEERAMAAIMPGFRACLPAKSRNRSFNITQVRLRLAEALFRMGPARHPGQQREAAK